MENEEKSSVQRYLDKLYQVRFWVKPDVKDRWEEAAKKAGYPSMRKFYMDAIEEKIEKLNTYSQSLWGFNSPEAFLSFKRIRRYCY